VSEPFPPLETFRCFACDPEHPKGLRLRFREGRPGGVRAEVTLGTDYEGLGGVVHGGILATLFDEAMAWCLYRHQRSVYVTAKMEQRFRSPVPTGAPLVVEAWIEDGSTHRRVRVAAAVASAEGATLAEGSGLFLPAPAEVLGAMGHRQRSELARVFAAFAARDGEAPS
jgi:acyl-coenzyme A thioesterase PaaI-like protein